MVLDADGIRVICTFWLVLSGVQNRLPCVALERNACDVASRAPELFPYENWL